MRKIPAVEEARAIMTNGMQWGVWKWLLEKRRVREAADHAREALDEVEKKVKAAWSDEQKFAYNQLLSHNRNGKKARKNTAEPKEPSSEKADAQLVEAAKGVMEADDAAYNAHEDAEDIFADAEESMSTSMAREGARKALKAYDLHEAAIRRAEALSRSR